MREGNVPRDSKCVVCKKSCHSPECFTGMRCEWCNITAHAVCFRQVAQDCDFGPFRKIMLPPNSVTIPRTELPMELNVRSTYSGTDESESECSPAGDPTCSGKENERDDHEWMHIYDGNNSLRNQIFRTASVPKTATVDQIRTPPVVSDFTCGLVESDLPCTEGDIPERGYVRFCFVKQALFGRNALQVHCDVDHPEGGSSSDDGTSSSD
ncbi:diacylglycerol kinase [Aphelenchoides avenae]|nr:diacylglycerol kinase [Aphelenchus avenae]